MAYEELVEELSRQSAKLEVVLVPLPEPPKEEA